MSSTNNNNKNQSGTDFHVGGERVEPTSTFTVAQSISSGKVPHNEQVLASLQEIEDPLKQQASNKGGAEGRIAQQTQQLLQHTRELLQDKNSDDTFDKIRTHAKEAGIALANVAKDQKQQTDQTKWTEEKVLEVRQLLIAFRNTATSLAKNTNFRHHLIELIQLFQTLFFDFTHSTLDKKLTEMKSNTQISESVGQIQPHVQPFTSTEEQQLSSSSGNQTITNPSSGEHSRTNALIQRQQSGAEAPVEQRKMTDEERKHSYEKLRTLMIELGHTPEYKQLVEKLTSFVKNNGQHISQVAGQSKDHSKSAITALGDDIQELLEKCSGGVSLTPLRSRIQQVILNIQNNADVRQFFTRVRELFSQTVTKPEEQHPEKIDAEIQSLSKEAEILLKKPEYREDMRVILDELKAFLNRVKEDEHLRRLGSDVQNLRREMMLNEKGQIDFGTIRNSLPALKNVLLPALTSALKTIPVPPIHSDDERYTIDVSNLSLSAEELLPENANIHFANDLFFDFSGHGNDRFDSSLSLALNDFTTTLKDLNFHYERKKMPKISDAGVADISIVGTSIRLRWKMEKVDDRITFHVDKVKCNMRELNTSVKEAQHKILDRFALKMFNTQIKRAIEQGVEKSLRERLEKFTINTTTSEISSSVRSAMPNFVKSSSNSSSSSSSTTQNLKEKMSSTVNEARESVKNA
jgi:gas vesicle protein